MRLRTLPKATQWSAKLRWKARYVRIHLPHSPSAISCLLVSLCFGYFWIANYSKTEWLKMTVYFIIVVVVTHGSGE